MKKTEWLEYFELKNCRKPTAEEFMEAKASGEFTDEVTGNHSNSTDQSELASEAVKALSADKIFCTKCGKELTEEMKFCTSCGQVSETKVIAQPESTGVQGPKKLSKNLKLGLLAGALVLVAVIIFVLLSMSNSLEGKTYIRREHGSSEIEYVFKSKRVQVKFYDDDEESENYEADYEVRGDYIIIIHNYRDIYKNYYADDDYYDDFDDFMESNELDTEEYFETMKLSEDRQSFNYDGEIYNKE